MTNAHYVAGIVENFENKNLINFTLTNLYENQHKTSIIRKIKEYNLFSYTFSPHITKTFSRTHRD